MFISSSRSVRYFLSAILSTILFTLSLQAQSTGTVRGMVVDPLGKLVPDAKLVLVQNDKNVVQGRSDAGGSFSLFQSRHRTL